MVTTLHDALTEAFAKSEAEAPPTPDAPPIEVSTEAPAEVADIPGESTEQRAARVRDEAGRFTKAEPVVAAPTVRAPPSSWKKDHWDSFGKLDPTLQDYINQRESEAANGVSTYKQQWDRAAPIYRAVEPLLPQLQQRGLQPDKWLQDLSYVDKVLSSGSIAEKTQLIHRMAAANGVTLGQGQGDPNLQYLLSTMNGLQNEVQSFRSQAAQQEQLALERQVKEFAVGRPHFEAVRSTMGQLLQSGVADSMQTAYDKAIRLHDDVWQEHQVSQAKEVEAKRQEEIARKKAAASSPRSSSPTGALTQANGNKSLRDQLSSTYDAVVSGRI